MSEINVSYWTNNRTENVGVTIESMFQKTPITTFTIPDTSLYKIAIASQDLVTSISLPFLNSVTEDISIAACAALTTLNFPFLSTVGKGIDIDGNNLVTSVSFPSLETADQTTSNGITINASAADTINLHKLTSVAGALDIGCSLLETIDLSNLVSVGSFTGSSLNELTTLSLPVFTTCTTFQISDAAKLTSLSFVSLIGCNSMILNGCALDETSVDLVLQALDANGISGGTCNLSGGTNSIPSAAGLAHKNSLDTKTWSVTVNS